MGSSQLHDERERDRAADAERIRRRNRLLVGIGLLCFIVGVPLVSLPDGTALSVIGLSLETVAGACVNGDVSPGAPRLAGHVLSSIDAGEAPWHRVAGS
jgi:hypothetical protein